MFKLIVSGVSFLFIVIIAFLAIGTVQSGYRGVQTRFSAPTGEIKNEGIYFQVPFIDSVKEMNVQIVKVEANASAASKDLQSVSSKVALNYHIDPSKVVTVYRELRMDYEARVIVPALQESVKASTSKFTAEELVTKRELVRDEISKFLQEKLTQNGIIVDSFNIVDFDFSDSFNKAIEAKVTAEQEALASKNKLEQVKYEAQQGVETAKGKAEAIRIESSALQNNPQVLELRALEKWNGVLPTVTSGAVPFINVSK